MGNNADPVCNLFQESIDHSEVLGVWRGAAIVAIHKEGPKFVFENFRQGSLADILCAVMQYIIPRIQINRD